MKKIVLIDGHSILNRAFFGIPDLTNSEGLHTNAVYGFLNIMFKILDEEKPDYLTVAFDRSEPTFRHEMYADYKGTRKPMAEELRQQVPVMKEVLHAMGIVTAEQPGLEADDILGTIAVRAEAAGMEVSIISGDRDLLQLATEKVKIRIPKTKRSGTEIEDYNAKDVEERYQVTPRQFIDVKALMGDSSDNIPGVPGIGEKGATHIIAVYKSIENAYEHVDEIKPKRAQTALAEHYEMAKMSKVLAAIKTDAEIDYDMESAAVGDFYTQEAYLWFKRLEFKQMLLRFEQSDHAGDPVENSFRTVNDRAEAERFFADFSAKEAAIVLLEEGQKLPVPGTVYRFYGVAVAYPNDGTARDAETAAGIVSAGTAGDAAEDGNPVSAPDSAGTVDGAAGYEDGDAIPASGKVGDVSDTISMPRVIYLPCTEVIPAEFLNAGLQQICDACEILITLDMKTLLKHVDIDEEKQPTDISLAAYLLNPLKNDYAYDDIAKDYLGQMIPAKADLLGKLKLSKAADEKPDAVAKLACFTAYTALRARRPLLDALREKGMDELYFETELPLVRVLDAMEKEGIRVERESLHDYGEQLTGRIAQLEQGIYEKAGEAFNINSPKQLGVILFEKLHMPNGKKTKTGYSTAADVLDKLAPDYPIVAEILEYRQLTKLKSTYAEGLGACIASDGRIHTTFNQTITATGRLSSTEPNLQNIPIRMEMGRLIRKVFIPADGFVFIDADYSQIELRVLAHMSADQNLIEAYRHAEDIHRITASQVFHTPVDEVTPLQRRNAKAVNFGIVYGISSFGLSQDLSISRKEAEEYIKNYFATFPGIKSYLDRMVADAKKCGFSVTMFGRRRPVPELSSSNFMQRSFGERIAMNSPIQGTAADIIKIAMNRVYRRLKAEGLRSRLILQVHDELLVEAARDEVGQVKTILAEEMRHAAELSVDLEVDLNAGENWLEAH
ncbi:MAG: DNA polymerase I [Lachnospiraceae bacterium]|nr:DNA polymerase I [Lachnospiraceae bacterium]